MCGHKKLSRREPSIFSFWAYLPKWNYTTFIKIQDFAVQQKLTSVQALVWHENSRFKLVETNFQG